VVVNFIWMSIVPVFLALISGNTIYFYNDKIWNTILVDLEILFIQITK